ncbi:MAG: cellobiose phosphorylase [Lachnospiraceae bacterium]|nr:cellobiose phosphorylase [Lachnospiraceae bacterium]
MGNYRLEEKTFVIDDYDKLPAFSSFLPGLAGVKGIPMWTFYTNRGQGINSFGIGNKGNAIMEFNSANTAYENTAIKGFRTFLKIDGEYYEPFFKYEKEATRSIRMNKNSFKIVEVNEKYGIETTVNYFVLPNESIGALVRQVSVKNIGNQAKNIEIIDGLPKIIPSGISNGEFKEMSFLFRSWSYIKNIENKVPYYTLRASTKDSAEVSDVEGGYYYLTIKDGQLQDVIYDVDTVYGYDLSLMKAVVFEEGSLDAVLAKEQCFANKVPCGFTPFKTNLAAGETFSFDTFIGYAGSEEQINTKAKEFCAPGYVASKFEEAENLVESFTKDVKTHTAAGIFDQYIEQCYLDNFLRGGYPYVLNKDGNKSIIHLFSRKHGDPERDYNFFSIAAEYYSQGNGNFRDVSQNRRNDVFFNKEVGDFNVKTFFSLIQADGYNPLEVRPSLFNVIAGKEDEVKAYVADCINGDASEIQKIVAGKFTPGQISNTIARLGLNLKIDDDEFIENILNSCDQNIEAGFGEGYWSDHWDYNMDLVDNYLSIYPDKIEEFLFGDKTYKFYDSVAYVCPREEKYVINNKGAVRQYGMEVEDEEKLARPGFNKWATNWLKTKDEKVYFTNLAVKMVILALSKFAQLDVDGMGVEMEGGKPGWNDAMNGLPGLFGSGTPETFELKRLVKFIVDNFAGNDAVTMPAEIVDYLKAVKTELDKYNAGELNDFEYWDAVATIREGYRAKVKLYFSGAEATMTRAEIAEVFAAFEAKIDKGIAKAVELGGGIVPTYLTHEVTDFEPAVDADGNPIKTHYGLQRAIVKGFKVVPLPPFLEGPARMIGTTDIPTAKTIYQNVKASDIYDKKLGMYKTSASIEECSIENGRCRAFTPGWQERENIFLHMEYKYILGIIKAGLYDEYYETITRAMIPFLDPNMYGRSILENSSFLASSANPNPDVHGRGFIARLSGSTTEMISMWIQMFMGGKVFTCEDGELVLNFTPKLADWLFDNGEASFTLLSNTEIKYINKTGKATFGDNAAVVEKVVIDGETVSTEGKIKGALAESVRNGEVDKIEVYFK